MKKKLIALINFGINPETPADLAEQIRLVNGISFLGVPVCVPYVLLFTVIGNYTLAFTFLIGMVIFFLPLFLNKWFGVSTGRVFIALMSSAFFGTMSVLAGKDAGFYLGFLVVSVPPIFLFPKLRTGIIFVCISVIMMLASIYGNMRFSPASIIPFPMSMIIYLVNLFTVLLATLGVVYIFKSELSESRTKLEEKNKEVTDSIRYAGRIQRTMMPTEKYVRKIIDRLKDKSDNAN